MDSKLRSVINKIRRKDVTLWVGAGLSLYTGLSSAKQIASDIVEEMPDEYRKEFKGKDLPEVAEEFVQMNNGSKSELFRILTRHLNKEPKTIEYHEKLSEIIQIKNIVTTNYDNLLEQSYKKSRLSVILKNSHIPVYNTPVKLYKIHGDMSEPESIVLTTSDYNDFFQFKTNNESLWTKITSLADESSFLFLGYSLEDPNVKKLIDKLIERVGNFQHESFLVVPDLPSYKEQDLNKKGITYINMTGEEFINHVHSEIMSKIIEDYNSGFLNPSEVDELLSKKGIEATFEYKKGESSLAEFGTQDENEPLNLKFDIKKEEHASVMNFLKNDLENQELEISSEAISNIVSEYKGIHFPPFSSSTELADVKIIKHPNKELEGSLVIKETQDVLEDIKAQIFTNKKGSKVKFIHESFTVQLIIKFENTSTQTFNVSYNFQGNLAKAYKAATFLQNWIVKGYTVVFYNLTDKNIIPLHISKTGGESDEGGNELIEQINASALFYKNLLAIQNHFGVYFTLPDKISEEDRDALNEALKVVYSRKDKVDKINLTLDKDNINDELLENEMLSFKSLAKDPEEVEIFGEKIHLGYRFIETLDGYLANKEDVLEQIKGNKTVNLVIKSRTNEMYSGYQDEKEITES